jgi:hypothetical protein
MSASEEPFELTDFQKQKLDIADGDDTDDDQRDDEPAHRDVLAENAVDWTTFWDTDYQASDWLLEPLIANGRTHSLIAKTKAGKSLLLLEACAALATGRPFLNKPKTEPVKVVYVDFEMTESDLHDRLGEFGYSAADDLTNLEYVFTPPLQPLDTTEGGAQFVAGVLRSGAVLAGIDTVSRAVQGDENAAETARDLYRHSLMPLKKAGVATIRLDHLGKDEAKGARGSSAKVADVGIQWSMKVTGDNVELTATSRMSWVEKTVHLTRGADVPMHRFSPNQVRYAWDAAQWLSTKRGGWVATNEAAKGLSGSTFPESEDKRRARRALNKLVDLGKAEMRPGPKGGPGGSSTNEYRAIKSGNDPQKGNDHEQ